MPYHSFGSCGFELATKHLGISFEHTFGSPKLYSADW